MQPTNNASFGCSCRQQDQRCDGWSRPHNRGDRRRGGVKMAVGVPERVAATMGAWDAHSEKDLN